MVDRPRDRSNAAPGAPLVVGLTGPMCAGKSEVSRILEAEAALVPLRLSTYVHREAERFTPQPTRADMQRVGDELRRTHGADCLARMALGDMASHPGAPGFVVDGIRNPAEIEALRALSRFTLVAVDAPREARFRRNIARQYLRQTDWAAFEAADRRELGEGEPPWGQHIEQCMEVARAAPFGMYIYNAGSTHELREEAGKVLRRVQDSRGGRGES